MTTDADRDEVAGPDPPPPPGAASGAAGARSLTLLSVVAPVFDEEGGIEAFCDEVRDALAGLPYELILVDDGSTDATPSVLRRLAAADQRIRVISLSRNFGHQAAITAGIDHARGDAVVTLDADLQDPPAIIPRLLERWREGADVVLAVRTRREGESRFKLHTARWFYRVFSRLAEFELENSGDFRLLDRRAADALRALPERTRFLRGLTVWVGFMQASVPYERDPRHAGGTSFSLRRMIRFSFDGITSFSRMPLQAATLLGFAFSAIAFIGLPVALVLRIFDQFVPGITTVLFVVLALGGIQLITVGIIGEYVGRIYDEVKARPLYVVAERLNVDLAPDLVGSARIAAGGGESPSRTAASGPRGSEVEAEP